MALFGGRGRGGMRITWILAAVIALFGVFKYFTSTQKNPVTGKSERVAMTPEQEVVLGLRTAPQMMAEMGGEVPESHDVRAQFVEAVGQKLVRQIDTKGGPMPWKFDFHLLNDPKTVNAFALPGGQCFITTALFSQLDNEAQLAGVLGHEIGHVIERHSAERMAKADLGQSLVGAVAVGASGDGSGYGAAQAAQVVNQIVQMRYGRDQELESDSYGVAYMVKAGYDPNEMIQVMEVLKKASGGGGRPEFMSTHPDPGNRAEQIRAYVQQHFPNGTGTLTKGRSLRDLSPGAGRTGWGGEPRPATPGAPGTPAKPGKAPW
jgi:predicted Zn-dependent protease